MPVVQRIYDFYFSLYKITKLLPKKDRYTLGTYLETTTLNLLKEALFEGSLPKIRKIPHLEEAIILNELLKITIRLSHQIRAIDYKKYELLQLPLLEIGRMLGGWKKSLL